MLMLHLTGLDPWVQIGYSSNVPSWRLGSMVAPRVSFPIQPPHSSMDVSRCTSQCTCFHDVFCREKTWSCIYESFYGTWGSAEVLHTIVSCRNVKEAPQLFKCKPLSTWRYLNLLLPGMPFPAALLGWLLWCCRLQPSMTGSKPWPAISLPPASLFAASYHLHCISSQTFYFLFFVHVSQ